MIKSCRAPEGAHAPIALSHASARAYNPLTAPNRVPSVRSQQPTSGRQLGAPVLPSAQLGAVRARPTQLYVDIVSI